MTASYLVDCIVFGEYVAGCGTCRSRGVNTFYKLKIFPEDTRDCLGNVSAFDLFGSAETPLLSSFGDTVLTLALDSLSIARERGVPAGIFGTDTMHNSDVHPGLRFAWFDGNGWRALDTDSLLPQSTEIAPVTTDQRGVPWKEVPCRGAFEYNPGVSALSAATAPECCMRGAASLHRARAYGTLYAAGWFDSIGGVRCRNIAWWDGTRWSSVGKGVEGSGTVFSLCKDRNGYLYAGGYFSSAGGVEAHGIAVWDGTRWDSLGRGVDGNFVAAMLIDTVLYAGGNFYRAGSQVAPYLATSSLYDPNSAVRHIPQRPLLTGRHPSGWSIAGSRLRVDALPEDDMVSVYSLSGKRLVRQRGGTIDLHGVQPQLLLVRVAYHEGNTSRIAVPFTGQ